MSISVKKGMPQINMYYIISERNQHIVDQLVYGIFVNSSRLEY